MGRDKKVIFGRMTYRAVYKLGLHDNALKVKRKKRTRKGRVFI